MQSSDKIKTKSNNIYSATKSPKVDDAAYLINEFLISKHELKLIRDVCL